MLINKLERHLQIKNNSNNKLLKISRVLTFFYSGQYSRKDTERIGKELGNFRNKPKVEEKSE